MDAIIRNAAVAGTHVLRRPQDRVVAAPAPVQAPSAPAASVLTPMPVPAAQAPNPTATPAPVPAAPLHLPSTSPEAVALAAATAAAMAEQRALCTAQAAQIERLAAERQNADAKATAARDALSAELAQAKDRLSRLEKEQAAAFDGAVRRGLAEGEERGAGAAMELVGEQVERFARISSTLAQSKLAVLADAEDMIVEIAFTALCRMLGENAADRVTVAALVRQIVHGERDLDLLTVHLHPQDLERLNDALGATTRIDPRVRLIGDAGIAIGGCTLEGPRGTLDASLDTQLTRLRDALLAVRAERRDAGEPV